MDARITINCPDCKGDGLYKRPTSYTRDGIPFCFRCDGTGKLIVTHRKAQKIAESLACYPFSKLVKVKTPEGIKLVPYNQKKSQLDE